MVPVALAVLALPSAALAQVPVSPPSDSGCGGLLQPPCPPPPQSPPPQQHPAPPPPPGTANITLAASKGAVLLGSLRGGAATVSGRVTGARAGIRVLLEAASPDYRRAFPPSELTLGSAGTFRFLVRPEVTTVYQAVIAPGQSVQGASRQLGILVYPNSNINFYAYTGRTVELNVTIGGPDVLDFADGIASPARGPARWAYFYLLPRRSKRLQRLGRGRLHRIGCSETCALEAFTTVRVTRRLKHGRAVVACTREIPWVGTGVPEPACGRRTIRLR